MLTPDELRVDLIGLDAAPFQSAVRFDCVLAYRIVDVVFQLAAERVIAPINAHASHP